MILTPDNEYCVVLDSCVLIPMPLCDTILRCAEEPPFYRVVWSEEILSEIRRVLADAPFDFSAEQIEHRVRRMNAAFPEALHVVPPGSVDGIRGIPDPDDRHVVALAVHSHANTIITDNIRDFPSAALAPHNLTVLSADEFLVHQYHLNPQIMLDKLDRQAAGIRRQRSDVLSFLQRSAPNFCELCTKREGIS